MSEERDPEELAEHVQVIREGHGANCSSIGSVIDTLFVAQIAAGALLAVVAATLAATKAETEPESKPESKAEPEK